MEFIDAIANTNKIKPHIKITKDQMGWLNNGSQSRPNVAKLGVL